MADADSGLDERILGELAVMVIPVGWPKPLRLPDDSVGVADQALHHPHPAAEVGAVDLAVLPDAQR